MGEQAWAHVKQGAQGELEAHQLATHLREVASMAHAFAAQFTETRWGHLAGLWHDLGKYRPGFQKYIRTSNDPDAHIEHKVAGAEKTHSAAGAVHAIETFKRTHGRSGEVAARVLAYLIASHHAGLYDWQNSSGEKRDLCDRLFALDGYTVAAKCEYEEALATAPNEILQLDVNFDPHKELSSLPGLQTNPLGFSFALRMLFSCLVDADFLDTERFLDAAKYDARTRDVPRVCDLLTALDAFVAERDRDLRASGRAHNLVNRLRAEVLAECRAKATLPRGLFSLEVPTGGGKTLSSLAFALAHAQHHQMRGVVYAVPYTSIIEQTADVFRAVFKDLGDAAVVEHHSQVDVVPTQENIASRLACENWDVPLVVTTNVQLFESMFAARTSRCRKLHNLANSVIILDEAQQLPPQFLQPILDALNLLVAHYGATVVLCTATQPVLQSTWRFDAKNNLRGLTDPTPIVDNTAALFDQLKRVELHLPAVWDERLPLSQLAQDIAAQDCALAIVDRKADARDLHALLSEDAIHLSTFMCGAHRSDAIAQIKQRLAARRHGADMRPLHVVSTQLVEAGVDLDFPVVYRAVAGLDSIAQAAGRCNREGLIERGQVFVFVPPKEAPAGHLRKAAQATRSVLYERPADPLTPDLFREYFRRFYSGCDLDSEGIVSMLKCAGNDLAVKFRSAAKAFRLIDEDTVPIIVRYNSAGDNSDDVDTLVALLERDGPSRWLLRKLQRYAVMLHRKRALALAAQGSIAPVRGLPDWFVQQSDLLYDPVVGLDPTGYRYDPDGYAM